MTEYRFLNTRREGAALVVELTNPPRNLLNAPMVAELTALANEPEQNSEIRVLILTGGVEGIFITHYDVGELSTLSDRMRGSSTAAPGGAELHGMHKLLLKLQSLPQPVIAAINGTAVAANSRWPAIFAT